MNVTEIVISAMKVRGYNQTILAEKAGLKRQTNVSEMLRSKSMRVDNFLLLLNSMDFDIVVIDRNKTNNNPIKWVVGGSNSELQKVSRDTQAPENGYVIREAKPDMTPETPKIDLDALLSDDEPSEKQKPTSRKIKLK